MAEGTAGSSPVLSEPRWQLFLDGLFVVAMLISVLGLVVMAVRDLSVSVVLAAGLVVLTVLVWLGLRRHSSPVLAWVLAACGLGLLLTSTGLTSLMLAFVAMVVLTVEVGTRPAALVAAASGPIVALFGWVAYRDVPEANAASLILDGIFISLCFGFAVIVGALLRDLEEARRAAYTANEGLARANERLRETMTLERDLVLAEERARSSRDLHDGLGARLTVTSMSLDYALRMRERDPERAWAEVARAAGGNRETLDHMRLWVRALSPPEMTPGAGGPDAFEAIADSFRGTGLTVRVEHSGSTGSLPPRVATLAYRLVQEGLTNTLRYAEATLVTITLTQSRDEVVVEVRDNGTGAAGAGAGIGEGFGLRSLREQAEDLGGSLTAGPHPDGGFRLAARLPLPQEPPA